MKQNKQNKLNNSDSNVSFWQFLRGDSIGFILLIISGTVFNIGLVFSPIFEGWLAQCLFDIIKGNKVFFDMLTLVIVYFLIMIIVQVARYGKRFYARKTSIRVNTKLRRAFYQNLVTKDDDNASAGETVTRAIGDIESVAEGVRRVLSEVFDTGVLFVAYIVTMMILDVKLTLISILFLPIACIIAELLKKVIYRSVSAYRKSAERLSDETFDRVNNATLYRVYGRDQAKNNQYYQRLEDYEKKSVRANVWENTLQPLYNVVAMIGVIFIVYFGGRNYLGIGFTVWDVAMFTAFISCYTKLADKTSKVAKLFNSVQRAKISWLRLKNNLNSKQFQNDDKTDKTIEKVTVIAKNVSCGFGDKRVLNQADFEIKSGEIVGVTGFVASGKSVFGKLFIKQTEYLGNLTINGKQLRDIEKSELYDLVSYQGHNSELFSNSVQENVAWGEEIATDKFFKLVELDEEINEMSQGENTVVGNVGIRLSGGQASRVALARTLAHSKSIIVLDDPFASVDKGTEERILDRLRNQFSDRLIILISHRLLAFPTFDKVIWINDGKAVCSTHNDLMFDSAYSQLYRLQSEVNND